jgi:hypothetical protein
MKTSELIGPALDWAVAKCEGYEPFPDGFGIRVVDADNTFIIFCPSCFWQQGGPIIKREGITIAFEQGTWSAYFRDNLFNEDGSEYFQRGTTPLIAAMRCYVASKLGDEVEIPEELK